MPRIRQQRKLGNQQHAAAHIGYGQIQLIIFILEHAQSDELFHAVIHVRIGIAFLRAHQHHIALSDAAGDFIVDHHAGLGNLLYHTTHIRLSPLRLR